MSNIMKSWCHTKRRMGSATRAHPCFGMTTTKTLRSVFSDTRHILRYCPVKGVGTHLQKGRVSRSMFVAILYAIQTYSWTT